MLKFKYMKLQMYVNKWLVSQVHVILGIIVFKIVIWGGKSSVLNLFMV